MASRAVDLGDVADGFDRTRTPPITNIGAERSQNSLICSSVFGALFKPFEIPGCLDGRHRPSIPIFEPAEAQVELVCNYINRAGAGRDGIGKPHISKYPDRAFCVFALI